MNTIENTTTNPNIKTIHLSDLAIQVPTEMEPEKITQAFQLYLEEHPEIITQVTRKAHSYLPKEEKTWASVAKKFRENAMGKEAGEAMEKARQEFRETFAIGDNF